MYLHDRSRKMPHPKDCGCDAGGQDQEKEHRKFVKTIFVLREIRSIPQLPIQN
jgi:hypothetical protein